MNKNNFCSIPNKPLLNEDSLSVSQSTIYNNGSAINIKRNIKKLKESIFNKDFRHQRFFYLSKKTNESQYIKNYILSKNILKKYTYLKKTNIGLENINRIIYCKKCHFTTIYNELIIYNTKIEYIKKFYKYNESIKIIPKREAYFKHLMQFLERPFFRNFVYNKIIKQIGLDKLSIYRRINYPKKLNKNLDVKTNIYNNNIIFNSNVIETIENCSTSMTQYSNRNNLNLKEKNNDFEIKNKINNNYDQNASMISEIKVNNCSNKKNDKNISYIDNSLLIIMKDLSVSKNKIKEYLFQQNNNYKNLYNKIKNKAKMNIVINKNDLNDNNNILEKKGKQINALENINNLNKKLSQTKKMKNLNFYKKLLVKKQSNNNIDENYNFCHNSLSSPKKINNIRIIPFNSNNLNSQINNKNSYLNTNKCCLSSISKNKSLKIHNLKKKFNNNKLILINKNNNNFHNYFNSNNSKENNNNLNFVNFLNNNKIITNLNNKDILKKIKKIVEIKEPKNKSMKKNIKTQKLLTDSSIFMLDFNSLNENEAKRKYQTINVVKSISISNNQFFNPKIEFKKNDYK